MDIDNFSNSEEGKLLEEKLKEAYERISPGNGVKVTIFDSEDDADEFLYEFFGLMHYYVFRGTIAVNTFSTEPPSIIAILGKVRSELPATVDYIAAHEVSHLKDIELLQSTPELEMKYRNAFLEQSEERETLFKGLETYAGDYIINICMDSLANETAIENGYGNEILAAFEWYIQHFDNHFSENPWESAYFPITCEILKQHNEFKERAQELQDNYFEIIKKEQLILEIADKKLYKDPEQVFQFLTNKSV